MFQAITKTVSTLVTKRWVGLSAISVLALLTLFGEPLFAQDLGVHGSIYEIQEQDALEWIRDRLNQLDASGEIERQQTKLKERAIASIRKPKPVSGLRKTTQPRTFEHDLTVHVPYDIKGVDDQVIHKAGTVINPLASIHTRKILLFLDGEDKEQVTWALKEHQKHQGLVKLILTNGPVIDLMEQHQVRFYFDQSGSLIRRFKIEQIPAMVEQKGQHLMVSEVKP